MKQGYTDITMVLDQQDRNLGNSIDEEVLHLIALAALAELTIALEALGEILKSPVENSHGLARIALDRIRALK
jgi:hypothetical protein